MIQWLHDTSNAHSEHTGMLKPTNICTIGFFSEVDTESNNVEYEHFPDVIHRRMYKVTKLLCEMSWMDFMCIL